MAVVRSLFGRFSGNATSDLKVADNVICLSDYDRIPDDPPEAIVVPPEALSVPPEAIGVAPEAMAVPPEPASGPAHDFVRRNTTDLPEKFTLGVKDVDAPLQTLGELMTATREKTGLSREEVAAETHIPAYYVRMIESDSYDAIPDQLYLLPFFRRYAIFLGLDAQKVVSRFIVEFEKSENEIVDIKALKVPKMPKPPMAPKAAKAPKDAKTHADKDANAKTILPWREVASAVMVAGVVLTFVARGFGLVGGAANRTVQHPASNPSSVASPATLPPSIVLSSEEVPPAEPQQQPAASPSADLATPEISAASPSPAIEQPPTATPAKHHKHHNHSHRIAKHSKHTTHKPG